jgi:hypothetical protein
VETYTIRNNWDLEPFVKIGSFKFGDDYTKYLNSLQLWDEKDQRDDELTLDIIGTDSFLITDETHRIRQVTCKDECNYKGVNLIGKHLEEVESILNVKAVYDDYLMDQDVYLIDEFGMTLWVNDGIVVTVGCSVYIDPDEI